MRLTLSTERAHAWLMVARARGDEAARIERRMAGCSRLAMMCLVASRDAAARERGTQQGSERRMAMSDSQKVLC